jgi:streptomycin 6-kinase
MDPWTQPETNHGTNHGNAMDRGVQGWDPAVDPDVVGASGFEPADRVLTVLNETC